MHPAARLAANTSVVALPLVNTADLAAILLPSTVRVICCCTPTAITFKMCGGLGWVGKMQCMRDPQGCVRVSTMSAQCQHNAITMRSVLVGQMAVCKLAHTHPCHLRRRRTRIRPASRICCPCTAGSQGMGMNLECQHSHPLLARTIYRNGWREGRRGVLFCYLFVRNYDERKI